MLCRITDGLQYDEVDQHELTMRKIDAAEARADEIRDNRILDTLTEEQYTILEEEQQLADQEYELYCRGRYDE